MGYQICYGQKVTKKCFSEPKKFNKSKTTLIWICILCLTLAFSLSKNKDAIINFLLPGDKDVTQSAITAFAEDLRQGESIRDAAVDFCREIIENAGIKN